MRRCCFYERKYSKKNTETARADVLIRKLFFFFNEKDMQIKEIKKARVLQKDDNEFEVNK